MRMHEVFAIHSDDLVDSAPQRGARSSLSYFSKPHMYNAFNNKQAALRRTQTSELTTPLVRSYVLTPEELIRTTLSPLNLDADLSLYLSVIKTANISDRKFTTVSGFKDIGTELHNLREVNCSYNHLSITDFLPLGLTALDISCNDITDLKIQETVSLTYAGNVSNMRLLTTLESLDLSSNSIHDIDGLMQLVTLFSSLRILKLSGNTFSWVRALQHASEIDGTNCQLGADAGSSTNEAVSIDKSPRVLLVQVPSPRATEVVSNIHVQEVHFDNTTLTDALVEHTNACFPAAVVLSLRNSRVSPKSLHLLAKLRHVRVLDLSCNVLLSNLSTIQVFFDFLPLESTIKKIIAEKSLIVPGHLNKPSLFFNYSTDSTYMGISFSSVGISGAHRIFEVVLHPEDISRKRVNLLQQKKMFLSVADHDYRIDMGIYNSSRPIDTLRESDAFLESYDSADPIGRSTKQSRFSTSVSKEIVNIERTVTGSTRRILSSKKPPFNSYTNYLKNALSAEKCTQSFQEQANTFHATSRGYLLKSNANQRALVSSNAAYGISSPSRNRRHLVLEDKRDYVSLFMQKYLDAHSGNTTLRAGLAGCGIYAANDPYYSSVGPKPCESVFDSKAQTAGKVPVPLGTLRGFTRPVSTLPLRSSSGIVINPFGSVINDARKRKLLDLQQDIEKDESTTTDAAQALSSMENLDLPETPTSKNRTITDLLNNLSDKNLKAFSSILEKSGLNNNEELTKLDEFNIRGSSNFVEQRLNESISDIPSSLDGRGLQENIYNGNVVRVGASDFVQPEFLVGEIKQGNSPARSVFSNMLLSKKVSRMIDMITGPTTIDDLLVSPAPGDKETDRLLPRGSASTVKDAFIGLRTSLENPAAGYHSLSDEEILVALLQV